VQLTFDALAKLKQYRLNRWLRKNRFGRHSERSEESLLYQTKGQEGFFAQNRLSEWQHFAFFRNL
jgi:hypothetical protein